jgi:nitrogen fixation/metabolism regulation signal transduction histidine kinase
VSVARLRQAVRDLSLNAKITLTLTAVFAATVGAFLAFLIPFLREQRESLLDKDKRVLSTLRDSYERGFIYDLISENSEALAVRLADLAAQRGLLWARVEAGRLDLAATADRATILDLVGDEARQFEDEPNLVLLVRPDGRGDLVTTGGRPLLSKAVAPEALPAWKRGGAGPTFEDVAWSGRPALYFTTELAAAAEPFGRLHILYSLADLERSQSLTRTLFYGLAGASFAVLLLLLNVLISAIVIAPVRNVQRAMSRAATGDLEVRLPMHSRDELGAMSDAFNRMVTELAASKRAVEDYSRNLEAMVAARTGELQESETHLRDLKNRLATIIANVATGVISLDEAGLVTTFNERAAEILSAPPDVEGRRLGEVLDGDARRIGDLVEIVRRRSSQREEAQLVCRLPAGRRILSVVVSALPGEGKTTGTVVVFDDLTDLLATQRLGAWKEAVERVIHEIKNPLTPVGLAAETLKSAHARDKGRFEEIFPSAIDMVLSSVRDLKELIAQFSRFSRLPEVHLERCRPNDIVRAALAPYSQGGPDGVRVRLHLADPLPEVMADSDELKRVLLNVVNNALEAMEGGAGELVVTTASEGSDVTIVVRDEGPGLEDVDRIFEPYYTTKPKGTGLGLAIARQIVDEHRGRITAESSVGQGTTVRIRLPAADA